MSKDNSHFPRVVTFKAAKKILEAGDRLEVGTIVTYPFAVSFPEIAALFDKYGLKKNFFDVSSIPGRKRYPFGAVQVVSNFPQTYAEVKDGDYFMVESIVFGEVAFKQTDDDTDFHEYSFDGKKLSRPRPTRLRDGFFHALNDVVPVRIVTGEEAAVNTMKVRKI